MSNTEEFLDYETRIKNAMDQFTAAIEHIRFVESDSNWEIMAGFLNDHSLEPTPQNLRFAFLALSRDNMLDLMALGQYAEPQPEPAPAPTAPQSVPAPFPRPRKTYAWKNGKEINIDQGATRL
jgi:hypothetical protein